MEFQCRVIVQRRCTSCCSSVENIPLQAERHSGSRQRLFGLPPESVFSFRPECCSASQRNGVRLQAGIAFTFDRIPHIASFSRNWRGESCHRNQVFGEDEFLASLTDWNQWFKFVCALAFGQRIAFNMQLCCSPQSLSLPVNNHSIVFPDVRAKRRSTAAPISLLPCSYLESCPWLTPSSRANFPWLTPKPRISRTRRPTAFQSISGFVGAGILKIDDLRICI
jgi:hypothetical protein